VIINKLHIMTKAVAIFHVIICMMFMITIPVMAGIIEQQATNNFSDKEVPAIQSIVVTTSKFSKSGIGVTNADWSYEVRDPLDTMGLAVLRTGEDQYDYARSFYTPVDFLRAIEKDLLLQGWRCPVPGMITNNCLNVDDEK
jgi:hypothetical protein